MVVVVISFRFEPQGLKSWHDRIWRKNQNWQTFSVPKAVPFSNFYVPSLSNLKLCICSSSAELPFFNVAIFFVFSKTGWTAGNWRVIHRARFPFSWSWCDSTEDNNLQSKNEEAAVSLARQTMSACGLGRNRYETVQVTFSESSR